MQLHRQLDDFSKEDEHSSLILDHFQKTNVTDTTMAVYRLAGFFSIISLLMVALDVSASQCSRPVRIMPLGDSITAGVHYYPSSPHAAANGYIAEAYRVGYRQYLYSTLKANNHQIDFVGNKQDGLSASLEGPAFDTDHQGTPGITDTAVGNNTYAWVEAADPDIVLLHIGTNGLNNSSVVDVEKILDEIDRYDRNIEVIVAQIIGQDPANANLLVEPFNNNLAGLIQQRKSAGDRVELLNMNSRLNYPGDLSDALHPNAVGYLKMANAWFAALDAKIDARCSGKPQFVSTPTTWAGVGKGYQYQADVIGRGAIIFSLRDNPAGMSINSGTGLVTWNPAVTGDKTVTIRAQGPAGTTDQSFTINVIDGIVVDNDESGTIASGNWKLDNSADIFGSDALIEKGDNNKSYTFLVPASGRKQVYLWWTANSGRAGNVPVEVYNGSETVGNRVYSALLNQTANGGRWNKLGEFDFTGNARVVLRGVAGSKYTSADAVRIMTATGSSNTKPAILSNAVTKVAEGASYSYDVNASGSPAAKYSLLTSPAGMTINSNSGLISWFPVSAGDFPVTVKANNIAGQDLQSFSIHVSPAAKSPSAAVIVIDNDDSDLVTNGNWEDIAGGYGGASQRASGSAATAVAVFTRSGVSGHNELALWWEYSPNWARSVPVTIYDGADPTAIATISLDQVKGGNQWYVLGSYNFSLGVRVEIQAEDHVWRKTVVDALRIRPDGLSIDEAPAIFSSPVTSARVGELYHYEIVSNANEFCDWALLTAPDGMTINAQQQTISWIPSDVGEFDVEVRMTRPDSQMVTQAYRINVLSSELFDEMDNGPVILDDADTEVFSFEGIQEIVVGGAVYGGQSRFSNDANGKFVFQSKPINGHFTVSLSWLGGQYRAKSVPLKIFDGDNIIAEKVIDQCDTNGLWHVIGDFNFKNYARIELGTEGTWRNTSADAVLLQPQ